MERFEVDLKLNNLIGSRLSPKSSYEGYLSLYRQFTAVKPLGDGLHRDLLCHLCGGFHIIVI